MPDTSTELELMAARRVVEAEDERVRRMAAAWAAYNGDYQPALHVKVIKGKRGPDDNVQANYAKRFVQTTVAALFGSELLIGFKDERIGEWLDTAWGAERRQAQLQQLGQNGAIAGQSVAKLVMPSRRYGERYPRVVVIDPLTYRAYWEPDDTEHVYEHRIQWTAVDDGKVWVYRQRIELADNGASWNIVDERSSPGSAAWATMTTALWPYAWAPIVSCQNLPTANEFYGEADLEPDVIRVLYAINRVASIGMRIIRLHGHPKTWAKGLTPNQVAALDVSPDGIVSVPGEGTLQNLEMNPQGLASIVDYLRRLIELAHELARVPRITTGKLESSGPLSGAALKVHYAPLTELTDQKHITYGPLVKYLAEAIVELAGKGQMGELESEITWPEVVPSDPKEEAATLILDNQLGLSKETALEKRGYDPTQEAKRREAGEAEVGNALLDAFSRGQAGGAAYPGNGSAPPVAVPSAEGE